MTQANDGRLARVTDMAFEQVQRITADVFRQLGAPPPSHDDLRALYDAAVNPATADEGMALSQQFIATNGQAAWDREALLSARRGAKQAQGA